VTAAGRPAILVPYPYATARHQHTNAKWMTEAGAATVIEDADLDGDRLAAATAELIGDRARLESMAAASLALARPDAAAAIAAEILSAAGESPVR
jgi:UDP-N-acetylglucosamine--N-acetylmuramyl-(pentapeptide) pyrophosphoryl-undecaprenol N-acetylglucosamine transferase